MKLSDVNQACIKL